MTDNFTRFSGQPDHHAQQYVDTSRHCEILVAEYASTEKHAGTNSKTQARSTSKSSKRSDGLRVTVHAPMAAAEGLMHRVKSMEEINSRWEIKDEDPYDHRHLLKEITFWHLSFSAGDQE